MISQPNQVPEGKNQIILCYNGQEERIIYKRNQSRTKICNNIKDVLKIQQDSSIFYRNEKGEQI